MLPRAEGVVLLMSTLELSQNISCAGRYELVVLSESGAAARCRGEVGKWKRGQEHPNLRHQIVVERHRQSSAPMGTVGNDEIIAKDACERY